MTATLPPLPDLPPGVVIKRSADGMMTTVDNSRHTVESLTEFAVAYGHLCYDAALAAITAQAQYKRSASAAQAQPAPTIAPASESDEMMKAIKYAWLLKLDLEATYEALGMNYWQTDIETAVTAIHALRAVQPVQPTPPGWKLVLIEPTHAMVSAGAEHTEREIEDEDDGFGADEFYRSRGQAIAVYSDMLAASPAHGIGAPAIYQTPKDAA